MSPGRTQEDVGGRDRVRTCDPLLAKQTGKNTKGFVWCRYTENWRNFCSLKCPEVVPNFSAPLNFRMQFHVRSAIGNLAIARSGRSNLCPSRYSLNSLSEFDGLQSV